MATFDGGRDESAAANQAGGQLALHKTKLIERAVIDARFTDIEFRALVAILKRMNRRPGRDFGLMRPSVPQIAADIGRPCSRTAKGALVGGGKRSVLRAIAKFERFAYLIVERTLGRAHRYRMAPVPAEAPVPDVASTGASGDTAPVPSQAPEPRSQDLVDEPEGVAATSSTDSCARSARPDPGGQAQSEPSPIGHRRSSRNPKLKLVKLTRAEIDAAFTEIWNVLPENRPRQGREECRRLFTKIIRSDQATIQEIRDGASHFASRSSGRTVGVYRWLAQGLWLARRATPVNGGGGSPPTQRPPSRVDDGKNPASAAPGRSPSSGVVKQLKRDGWISILGKYMQATQSPDEVQRFWLEAMKPPAESRPYLNRIDAAMRSSPWWRERQATSRRP